MTKTTHSATERPGIFARLALIALSIPSVLTRRMSMQYFLSNLTYPH